MISLLNLSLKEKKISVSFTGRNIEMKGPLGKLSSSLSGFILIKGLGTGGSLSFFAFSNKQLMTFSKLLLNAYKGLVNGYFIELTLKGIGYRGFVVQNSLFLQLGFSHLVVYNFPSSISVKCKKSKILIFGSDLAQVSQIASEIRKLRVPDSYKGKGILYFNEQLSLKVGKQR